MAVLKRQVLRSADGISANSSTTRSKILELNGEVKAKTYFIPAVSNPGKVDAKIVQRLRAEYNGCFLIAFAGRLIEEKGIFDLFDALKHLFEESIDFTAVILGEGSARHELECRVSESPFRDRVHLVGWRPGDEVASWMAAADLLVVPSKPVGTWQEAQGLVVVEAMAVRTPVVASRIGGIPDMVIDGETGRLFNPGDARQLAEVLKECCADYENCKQMAQAAWKKVAQDYAPDSVAELTSELYARLISKNASAR
jgi:glycosyltransferase involved in cell wall biosynthesis